MLLAVALAAVVAGARGWRGRDGRAPHPALRGAVDGALIGLGVLAVVDNLVFHWLLAFHRFEDGWSGSIYVEVLVAAVGVVMVAVGARDLRLRTRRSGGSEG